MCALEIGVTCYMLHAGLVVSSLQVQGWSAAGERPWRGSRQQEGREAAAAENGDLYVTRLPAAPPPPSYKRRLHLPPYLGRRGLW